MDGFRTEFKILWDTKVKAQVQKCSPEYGNILNSEQMTEEEKNQFLAELKKKNYIDLTGQYYIGRLVWAVEHALADDRKDLNFLNCFMQVHGCLNSEDYWKNVFENNLNSAEAVELLKLKDMLNELTKLL